MTKCEYPEAHEAHLAVNGECPWCLLVKPEAQCMTVEEAEKAFG